MTETPQQAPDASSDPGATIDHNIRIVYLISGEHIICNFGQIREEDKFVAYQLLYPLTLSLTDGEGESFNVTYRRWNPYTPYEDHRINPATVVSSMPPADDILKNYVVKLDEAGIDLGFLPNNGNNILGRTDGEPTQEPTGATTEGPVATGEGGGD